MDRPRISSSVTAVTLLAFLVVATAPAFAYDKMYRFKNRTEDPQTHLKVTLQGLEVTLEQYTNTDYNKWGEGAASFQVNSGVYDTVITWGDGTAATYEPLERGRLGWNTSDGECRLRDMRWMEDGGATPGDVIAVTDYSDVPGGGRLYWGKTDGRLYWEIINDTVDTLRISQLQLSSFSYDLGIQGGYEGENGLEIIAERGVTGLLIDMLREKLLDYWVEYTLPDPTVRSLERKIDNADRDNRTAYSYQDDGKLSKAIVSWLRAAADLDSVLQELQTSRSELDEGDPRVDAYLYMEKEVKETIRLLRLLPGVDPIPIVGGTINGSVILPPYNEEFPEAHKFTIDLTALGIVLPLPTDEVPDPQIAVIVSGAVIQDGVELNFVDQVIAKWDLRSPTLVPPLPTSAASATEDAPIEWLGPDDTLDITAIDGGSGVKQIHYDLAYGATAPPTEDRALPGLGSNAPVSGHTLTLPDDLVDPDGPDGVWSDGSGWYEVTCIAEDNSGNLSAPLAVQFGVDLIAPTIASAMATPEEILWSPAHDMVPVLVEGIGIYDAHSGAVLYIEDAYHNQGENSFEPDIDVVALVGDTAALMLRAERDGNLGDRVYTIVVGAIDAVGNKSVNTETVTATVVHDQGG